MKALNNSLFILWPIIILILSVFTICCSSKPDKNVPTKSSKPISSLSLKLSIQPFSDLPDKELQFVIFRIKQIIPSTIVAPKKQLPMLAYYKPRNRYRADSLIHWFNRTTPAGYVTLGLTSKDISTTKGSHEDFGIMGLGNRPGNACIASSFRLSNGNKAEELFKVAIHELGHTQGLPHCPNRYCFMRDAEGGNTTGEEKEFCPECKQRLISKGWKL